MRLTAQEAGPPAVGISENAGALGRVPPGQNREGPRSRVDRAGAEAKLVAKDAPPPANGVKVQTLKGGDYVRVWFNKAGNYYLVHLPRARQETERAAAPGFRLQAR